MIKRLVLVRGHQGSGKSTFAKNYKREFEFNHPNAKTLHLENDQFLYNDKGEYVWTSERVDKAITQVTNEAREAFKQKVNLIIVSNMFVTIKSMVKFLELAKKHQYEVEIYRTQNWFENEHGVDFNRVLKFFTLINETFVSNESLKKYGFKLDKEEILVPPVHPANEKIQEKINEIMEFNKQLLNGNLPFDNVHNTYVTSKYLAVKAIVDGYIRKNSHRYPDLSVLKYKGETFYQNTWDKALVEMRGLVVDRNDNIIIRPFKKLFNYSERIAENAFEPLKMKDSEKVYAVRKVNGFLGCVTYVKNHQYDQIICSTTGSLDSAFVELIEKQMKNYPLLEEMVKSLPNHTFMFEVCDETDPHIIKEQVGLYLIGCRKVFDGYSLAEKELDKLAIQYSLLRPESQEMTFGELKEELKTCKHEGFMVSSLERDEQFKMKSPFYLVSKFLGRSDTKNIESKLNKTNFDEEFYPLIDYINQHLKEFNQKTEQEKLKFIQEFLSKL